MTTLVSGRTATYDAWNRLVKVNGAETTEDRYDMTYRYDAMNRRIRRMTTHLLNAQWYYDDYYSGQQVIETRNEVATDRQYVWSPRYIDAPILRDQYLSSSSGDETLLPSDRIYYLGDANYNVTGLLYYNPNAAVWNVAERYAYTPYGQVQYRDSDWIEYDVQESIYSNTVLYTGRTLDVATSLYYYRARYYDASLERFISRDPIGYKGGMNLYEYCRDNPIILTDPLGLESSSDPCNCEHAFKFPEEMSAEGRAAWIAQCKKQCKIPTSTPPAQRPAQPSPDSDGIYYCERLIQPDGQGCGDKVARKCKWKHIDIYSVYQGKVYHGATGGQTGSTPGLPTGPDVTCHKLERKDYDYSGGLFPVSRERSLKWGANAKTPCSKATMADIVNCLQSRTTNVDPGLMENCQTDSNDALADCCMSGFMPLTIMPQFPSGWTFGPS
ncbi:MAG: RHS repeat-associated core domain-containing protein [Thermoguttaceae bacterium]